VSHHGPGVALAREAVSGISTAPVTDWGRRVVSAPSALEAFSGSTGPVHIRPRALATPRSPQDLASLVRWAREEGETLIPRGAGTGMPGGNVGPGIVVDLTTHFDWIDPPDGARRTVRAGVGAIAAPVNGAARSMGGFLPFLPSSRDRCSVGGMVANNAAGARSFRFGAVRSWVESLDVVLTDGQVLHLSPGSDQGSVPGCPPPMDVAPTQWPRVRKNSSGYELPLAADPTQLLVGSEGTLGLITAATFRTEPLPRAMGVAVLGLEALELLPELARQADSLGFWACEFFHRSFIRVADLDRHPEVGPFCRGMESMVLLEVGGDQADVERALGELSAWAGTLRLPWAQATEESARTALWSVRHSASPIIAAQAERGLISTQFIEDSVVPVDRLPDYLTSLKAILDEEEMEAVFFGHAGDGNVHVNPLVDRRDPSWPDRIRRILEDTATLVRSLGGTLAGEHGDGRIRAPYLERIWGPENVTRFRAIKDAWDPHGILNPGVILPAPGQDPLEGVGAGWSGTSP